MRVKATAIGRLYDAHRVADLLSAGPDFTRGRLIFGPDYIETYDADENGMGGERGGLDDWILLGAHGDFYVVAGDRFRGAYEEVE